MTRPGARLLFVLALLAGCGGSTPSERTPASAVIDVTAIVDQLGTGDAADDEALIDRLATLGDAAVPTLRDAAIQKPEDVRLAVVDALGQIDTTLAVEALLHVVGTNDNARVRASALLALGDRDSPAIRAAFEAALADPSVPLSQTAGATCGARCTSGAAIDRILTMALDTTPAANFARVRATLRRILDGSDQAATDYARSAIRTRTADRLAPDQPPDRRARAALLAADAGIADMETVIAATVTSSPAHVYLRVEAIGWLGQSGTAAAVGALQRALNDPVVAPTAARALQAMAARGIDTTSPGAVPRS